MATSYHHGNLRDAVLRRAAEVIATSGTDALSLRAIAVDLGVSHAAPRHHFRNRDGVLTALAAQGFARMAAAMAEVRASGFVEVGVAYVEFAVRHPAHFQVMFTPRGLDAADPELDAARRLAFDELRNGVATLTADDRIDDPGAGIVAGWSLVHGLATLALTGNLDGDELRDLLGGADLSAVTRRAAGLLYRPDAPAGDAP